jgi:hypothetical protein
LPSPAGTQNNANAVANPSGALIKAVMLAGASPLLGVVEVSAGLQYTLFILLNNYICRALPPLVTQPVAIANAWRL